MLLKHQLLILHICDRNNPMHSLFLQMDEHTVDSDNKNKHSKDIRNVINAFVRLINICPHWTSKELKYLIENLMYETFIHLWKDSIEEQSKSQAAVGDNNNNNDRTLSPLQRLYKLKLLNFNLHFIYNNNNSNSTSKPISNKTNGTALVRYGVRDAELVIDLFSSLSCEELCSNTVVDVSTYCCFFWWSII